MVFIGGFHSSLLGDILCNTNVIKSATITGPHVLKNSALAPHRLFDLQDSLDELMHFPPQLSDFVPSETGFIVSAHRLPNTTLLTLIATL